jgi:hypothetical protein
MGESLKQSQSAGDHSTNIQAGTVEIHQHGLTSEQARQIALDVFKANALELAGIARDLFETRGREFIDRYLEKVQRQRPEALDCFCDPDMLFTVFTAQRDYARTGRTDLEALLVELLIQRSGSGDLRQIVLNEAIAVASKLTEQQLDVLSFLLIFVHAAPIRYSFETLVEFGPYLRQTIIGFWALFWVSGGFLGIPATQSGPPGPMGDKLGHCGPRSRADFHLAGPCGQGRNMPESLLLQSELLSKTASKTSFANSGNLE